GESRLADRLTAVGFTDVTVLDLSATAVDAVRARLGARASYVVADVREWEPARPYDLWHDRAMFHFLNDPADRDAYARAARAAVRPGGWLVLGVFAPDGPESCSGLAVARHDAGELAARFADGFAPRATEREGHVTPGGATQWFTWLTMQRTRS
ncbi:MAG TPA: methyltransferase domain-containing protein, partial [Acidimicrobiales bacterium]|nr:methyltransferase domain-containing protein [Acidimicrobiales bacterium]